jgi:hypothetical protein
MIGKQDNEIIDLLKGAITAKGDRSLFLKN